MRTKRDGKPMLLGDLVAASYDRALLRGFGSREVSLLAARTVMQLLQRVAPIPALPPSPALQTNATGALRTEETEEPGP